MDELIFFDSEEDLKLLTGLSSDELWEHGFNLDDWDWGFCTSSDCFKRVEDEFGSSTYVLDESKRYPYYFFHLLMWMENYCVGYCATKYNDKTYFTLHHS